ncbi:MAG: hypothetical protein AAB423_03830 [Patescibacteria group bacterium]
MNVSQNQLVHEILAQDFTDRYLERTGFDKLAFSAPYEPKDPLCDYEKTFWEARPNRFSEPIGKRILGKMHRMSGEDIDEQFVAPFVEKAPEITADLQDFPVMLVNDHSPDLQAALALHSATIGIAHASENGRYQENLEAMIRRSHGIATRGLAPIVIGKPGLPNRLSLPFMRLQQLVVNPHLSFPINQQMIDSGIPEGFRKEYNSKLRADSVEVASNTTDENGGFTLWSLSPGGTPNFPGQGEHEGKILTKKVEDATIRLIGDMGCGLLPVYTSFGRGERPTVIRLGGIVPPNEVTELTVPTMMTDIAQFRRNRGEPDVFYEGEL